MKIAQHKYWTWADFIKRFKKKRLGFVDIDPLWIRVALPLLVVSGGAPLLIDSESDLFSTQPSKLTAIIFLFFSLAIHGALSAHAKWPRASLVSSVWMIVWPIILGVIHAGFGLGFILWINALAGEQNKIILTGPIIEKNTGGGRHTGKDYFLTVKSTNRLVKLAVSAEDYKNYPIGPVYSKEMIYGGLGIYYSWR